MGSIPIRGNHCYEAKSFHKSMLYCFQIVTMERLWVLCTESRGDLDAWKKALVSEGLTQDRDQN